MDSPRFHNVERFDVYDDLVDDLQPFVGSKVESVYRIRAKPTKNPAETMAKPHFWPKPTVAVRAELLVLLPEAEGAGDPPSPGVNCAAPVPVLALPDPVLVAAIVDVVTVVKFTRTGY